jgi:hypothetical protein
VNGSALTGQSGVIDAFQVVARTTGLADEGLVMKYDAAVTVEGAGEWCALA